MGIKGNITEEDIYDNLQEHDSGEIVDRFSILWSDELQKKKPSVLRMFYKAYGMSSLSASIVFSLIDTSIKGTQPLFLGALISYFVGDDEVTQNDAYLYALGIALYSLIPVLVFHPFILYMFEVGMKLRLGSCGLIYQKILRFPRSASTDGLNGQAINLMSNDVGKLDVGLFSIHNLWKGPMQAILLGYLIYREIGVSGLVGTFLILSFVPLQFYVGKKSADYRSKTTKRTDLRVRFMNEIIQGIQIIKMYTWENSFAKMIEKIRKKEMQSVRGSSYILALLLSFWAVSRVSIFLSLITYVWWGNRITARKVYIVSAFFNILNSSLVKEWPLAITSCAEAFVSVKRIQEFLLLIESKAKIESLGYKKIFDGSLLINRSNSVKLRNKAPPKITMDCVTASWISKCGLKTTGVDSVTLKIEEKNLYALVGAVGSGKSSLLQVLLKELEVDSGHLNIDGSISYASQEPWLFGASIKNNILFVEEYEESRYRQVIKVCALERDLKLLPDGDDTIVGERGTSLSGGQKARINLARCVYKNADIYLLDDPLSAVDTHVGRHLFKNCIQGFLSVIILILDEFLKLINLFFIFQGKSVILVTHQLQYLKKMKHVVLISDGKIEAQNSYDGLRKSLRASLLSITPENLEKSNKDIDKPENINLKAQAILKNELKPVEEEKEFQAEGSVDLRVYKEYFKSVGCFTLVFFTVILRVLAQFAASGIDYFVAQWVNWEESVVNKTSLISTSSVSDERQNYVIFYASVMMVFVVITFQGTFLFFHICLKASRNLHDKLFRGVTGTFMTFFSENPSGRILNRFSKDIGNIDTMLPMTLYECAVVSLSTNI